MANIEVGDKVRFLNEVGQGIVTRIQNKLVYVLTDEGFEIPVQANQLVVVEKKSNEHTHIFFNDADTMNYNYAERDNTTYKETFNIQPESSEPISNDIYVAFVPTQGKDENRDLFLINDAEQNFTFCVFIRKNNNVEFVETGLLESGTKIFLKELSKEDIAQISTITLQGVLYNPDENKTGNLLNKELKINALYLLNINYFRKNDFFDEPTFLLSVLMVEKNQQLIKQQKIEQDIKETLPVPPKESIEKPELIEVDLHIPALIDDYKDLTPTEMLQLQLAHFRKKMEEYILTPTVKKVVFIHGVGNGTLKIELRRILSREYAHYDYQDASYQEYGFGATMVILRK